MIIIFGTHLSLIQFWNFGETLAGVKTPTGGDTLENQRVSSIVCGENWSISSSYVHWLFRWNYIRNYMIQVQDETKTKFTLPTSVMPILSSIYKIPKTHRKWRANKVPQRIAKKKKRIAKMGSDAKWNSMLNLTQLRSTYEPFHSNKQVIFFSMIRFLFDYDLDYLNKTRSRITFFFFGELQLSIHLGFCLCFY